MKSQFEEKERSKLDQIEEKLKQLNKFMKKDKPKSKNTQKKANPKNLEKMNQNKMQSEMHDNEEHKNEEIKTKPTKQKKKKIENSKDDDIEDMFGIKDVSSIQKPKGRFDPLNQQKVKNKIEFKAEPASLVNIKKQPNKQLLNANKNDSDYELEEIEERPYQNALSAIKSNRKFEKQEEEPKSFRNDQNSQKPQNPKSVNAN